MAGLTYSTLIALIQNYLNRNDASTIATIPFFVQLAQERLSREAPSLGNEAYVTGNFIQGNAVLAKPANWRATLAMNYGTGNNNNTRNPIFQRDYDFVRMYAPDDSVQGLPLFYADYGYTSWIIAPTPNGTYPFEISYLQLPEELSLANQTNWYSEYVPDLLFYSCMLETSIYLKDDERIPSFASYYEKSLASMLTQSHSRLLDRQSFTAADKLPTNNFKGT